MGESADSKVIGAIDAGSNGMRILVARATADGLLTKLDGYREPVRLGADAFSTGTFSKKTIALAVNAFEKFSETLAKHNTELLRAVATSATRTASNREQLVESIETATGIQLDIIGGLDEARFVYDGVAEAVALSGQTAMLIDMGGGSVEITVADDGKPLGCETFPLGTVRLMETLASHDMKERDVVELVRPYQRATAELLEAEIGALRPALCIATGGNPECIGRLRASMLGKADSKKAKPREIRAIAELLLEMSVKKRIEILDMRPDRADVIAIASTVLAGVLEGVDVKEVLIPGVGLKEGLLRSVAGDAFPRPKSRKRSERNKP